MNLMNMSKFIIDKVSLRKDFYYEEWTPRREWFLKNFKGTNKKEIQEEFYKFLERVKFNIPFFDYSMRKQSRKISIVPSKQN